MPSPLIFADTKLTQQGLLVSLGLRRPLEFDRLEGCFVVLLESGHSLCVMLCFR